MARTISIGAQGYEELRTKGYFYVDKTSFVSEWWEAADVVTLVCRPRRFGKTLNLDTVRCFLSTEFVGRGEELFGGTDVWEDGAMRAVQGTVPVVFLSFARVKQTDFGSMLRRINRIVSDAAREHAYLLDWEGAGDAERAELAAIGPKMDAETCANAPNLLCGLLRRYHGVAPVVLIDEYDTPMERAWVGGFWDQAADFMHDLMNSTFKDNADLGRGLITGVTRVARESIFSDLNNLEVVTTSSPKYRTAFGFTQTEVDAALAEYGLEGHTAEVRRWYDGFTFGGVGDVYNPWSITNLLDEGGSLQTYWANTSSNGLVSEVVRRGDEELKADFEELMRGGTIEKVIDEQVVFSELETMPEAVWALLLAAGYVTSPGPVPVDVVRTPRLLRLTNLEVELCFDRMAKGWFSPARVRYNQFARALFAGDARVATRCLAEVTRACVSSFDAGTHPAESEPERFYHGLVLGLLASLRETHAVESNRESGFGRYDVALVPKIGSRGGDTAVVMEFKVFDPYEEETLADTVRRARAQVEERRYAAGLVARGIDESRIRTFGIAFRGKEVLVG